MKIRQAGKEDARLLSKLNVYVQRLHAEAYPDLFKLPEQDDFAVSFFEMFLDNPAVTIFIAEDPHPVGYVVCRVVKSEENPFMVARSFLYIDQISVEPEYHGKGIGKALMARAAQLAERESLPKIALDSWDFNQDAHAFFHSQGYEIYNVKMWKR
jgi:ribosomal protein S18 acetylase RimI-like enzyme